MTRQPKGMSAAGDWPANIAVLQETYYKVLSNLVSWFTWFCGTHVLAMGWLVTATHLNFGIELSLSITMLISAAVSITIMPSLFYQYSSYISRSRDIIVGAGGQIADADLIFSGRLVRGVLVGMTVMLCALFVAWIAVIAVGNSDRWGQDSHELRLELSSDQ